MLVEGSYRVVGNGYQKIKFENSTGLIHGNNGKSHSVKLSLGNFGPADPAIVESTGRSTYNIQFLYSGPPDMKELGVVSQDGLKITLKGSMGIATLDWMTEEEAAALVEEVDPIEAPPGPYKIQPNNLGKFLWITGSPGLGKSTSAQLLSKLHGYVYYEGDCFSSCKNPYIPVDVADPSLAQANQNSLVGEGLEKRRDVIQRSGKGFQQMLAGEKLDQELLHEFSGIMCEDISRERQRIGGDWAIASLAMNKEFRDIIRSFLGPDLVFIVLNMEREEVRERLMNRHRDHEGMVDMLMKITKLCEAATEDEDQAINVLVTKDMSQEDVVNKIMEVVG